MFIPLFDDEINESDRGVTGLGAKIAAAAGGAVAPDQTCTVPPTAEELDEFRDERYELQASAAARLGLAFLTGSVSGNRKSIVTDFMRGAFCTSESGSRVFYGASCRLVVDVSGFSADAKLTLPVIAAQVEMGVAKAMYRLSAKGYVGKISDVLGASGDLNVENYVNMIKAIDILKGRIADDTANVRPRPLYLDVDQAEVDVEAGRRLSVGATFALSQIASGRSLKDTRSAIDWESWSPEAQGAILSTFSELLGDVDAESKPSGQAVRVCQSLLGPLRLKT